MSEAKIDIESFLDALSCADPDYKGEIEALEKKFNCNISVDVEKHNALQFTYYYEVDFYLEESFFVEIESGINNGTRINSEGWGSSSKPTSRIVQVLKDVILDNGYYPDLGRRRLAQAVLNANKHKFFEFERQNNYDNYVTGGNSRMKLNGVIEQLHVEYIYEEKEVDVNFV